MSVKCHVFLLALPFHAISLLSMPEQLQHRDVYMMNNEMCLIPRVNTHLASEKEEDPGADI